MKNKIFYKTTVVKEAIFHIFGTEFRFETNHKKLSLKNIVPFLCKSIVESRLEYFRKDDKKVILFYKKSHLNSHVKFVFAVEADSYLLELQNAHDESNIPKMIQYMFENRNKLNFNI